MALLQHRGASFERFPLCILDAVSQLRERRVHQPTSGAAKALPTDNAAMRKADTEPQGRIFATCKPDAKDAQGGIDMC